MAQVAPPAAPGHVSPAPNGAAGASSRAHGCTLPLVQARPPGRGCGHGGPCVRCVRETMPMNRFLSLATAVGGLLGLALAVLASVAFRLVGVTGDLQVLVAGLVAGFGIGLLGGVWIAEDEEAVRRERERRRKGIPPQDHQRDPGRSTLFGPLAFGLTFVTIGSFAGLRAAQELSGSATWAPLAGIAWLTLAIAGGAGGVIAGAVWQVVVARLLVVGE